MFFASIIYKRTISLKRLSLRAPIVPMTKSADNCGFAYCIYLNSRQMRATFYVIILTYIFLY